jgi:hypothetical protein
MEIKHWGYMLKQKNKIGGQGRGLNLACRSTPVSFCLAVIFSLLFSLTAYPADGENSRGPNCASCRSAFNIPPELISAIIQVESGGNPSAISPQGCIGLMQINPKGALKEWNENYQFEISAREFGFFDTNEQEEYEIEMWKTHPSGFSRMGKSQSIAEGNAERIQLKQTFHRHYTQDLFDRAINVKIGTWYLTRIYNHYLQNINDNLPEEKLKLTLAAYNGGIGRLKKCTYDINCMPKETQNYVRKVMKLYKQYKNEN